MKYYAKVNTADPKTGFISVGEYLTDAQVEALGKDKVKELLDRNVLGCTREITEKQEKAAPVAPPAPAPEEDLDGSAPEEDLDGSAPEEDPDTPEDEGETDEDEPPELDGLDDIVADADEAQTAEDTKKAGRRKTK